MIRIWSGDFSVCKRLLSIHHFLQTQAYLTVVSRTSTPAAENAVIARRTGQACFLIRVYTMVRKGGTASDGQFSSWIWYTTFMKKADNLPTIAFASQQDWEEW